MRILIPNIKIICFILSISLAFTACKKNPDTPTTPTDDTIYTSTCGAIDEIIWLSENVSVLLNSHCGSNIYIFNTSTKTTRTWNVPSNFLIQRFYSTPDIPGKVFLTTMTKDATGAFNPPFKLYSLGTDNFDTILVKGDITDNTYAQGYTGGGKKLVLKTSTETALVDLETRASQSIPSVPATSSAQALSPDNSKILFFQTYSNPITNATTYDLNCTCTQPITLSGYGKAIWRSAGILGYGKSGTPEILTFQNLQTGAVAKTFSNFLAGPWISAVSNLAFLFVKGTTWSTDFDAVLISYDLTTNQTRELVHAQSNPGSPYLSGIFNAAQSPDGTKLAYVVNGSKLKLITL